MCECPTDEYGHIVHIKCLHIFCIYLCPVCDDGERYRAGRDPACSCY